MLPQTTKAVFFDLDETLIKNKLPVKDVFSRMFYDFEEQLGVENKSVFFEQLRTGASELWNSMFERPQSPEEQLIVCFEQSVLATEASDAIAARHLAENMYDRFLHLSSSNVELHDGALDTLVELSNRGYITGIITNGIERIQLGKIHALGLQAKVDHVTVSAQARAHKPEREVFELALGRANVAAEHAWQVGDHPTNDVAGAIRAGMGGIFYDPNGDRAERAFADLEEKPTHTVNSLRDTLNVIE